MKKNYIVTIENTEGIKTVYKILALSPKIAIMRALVKKREMGDNSDVADVKARW